MDPHAGGAQQPSSNAITTPAARPIQSQMGPNPLLAAGLGQLPHGTAVSNTWPHAQALLPSHAQSAYHAQSASQCPSLRDVQIQTFIAAMQQQQQRQPQLQPQPVHSNILAQIRAFTPQASPLTPMRAMPCGTASCLLLACWGDPSELTWCATAGAAMVFAPNAAAFAAPNGVQSWSGDSPPLQPIFRHPLLCMAESCTCQCKS